MPDSFTLLTGENVINGETTCPNGSSFSTILQKCMTRDDYIAAVKAAIDAGNLQLAHDLRTEAAGSAAIDLTGGQNIVSAVLAGDWGFVLSGLLPIIVGLIGLLLVLIAVTSWLNMDKITVAGVGVPLPNVK